MLDIPAIFQLQDREHQGHPRLREQGSLCLEFQVLDNQKLAGYPPDGDCFLPEQL